MTKLEKISFIIFILLTIHLSTAYSYGQKYDKIIPLESSCDDVKMILSVEKCELPQSIYRLKDFTIVIQFVDKKSSVNDKICYKMPSGTVASFTITFNKLILLKDLDYKLELAGELNNDISTVVYKNKKKGITVFTSNGVVGEVIYIPTQEKHQKYAYLCSVKKNN